MIKKIILIVITICLLSGCSVATKTKELGSGMTNVNHPIVFLPGLALFKLGLSLEEKEKQEKKEKNKINLENEKINQESD